MAKKTTKRRGYQRVFKVGSKYNVIGGAGKERRLLCVGRTLMQNGDEHLIFRVVKTASKRTPKPANE